MIRGAARHARNVLGPAAFSNGLIANIANNYAILADAESSFTRHNPRRYAALAIDEPPVVFADVFLTRQALAVDKNGAVWKERQLAADSVAFPAVDLNWRARRHRAGVRTFDLAPMTSVGRSAGCRYSSPAVDANGSVFAGHEIPPSMGSST